MPITKSAKKALRKSIKNKKSNLSYKVKIKKLLKDIKKNVVNNNITEAEKLLPLFYKAVDKAAKEKVIKKNTASRKKSRVSKLIKKTKAK